MKVKVLKYNTCVKYEYSLGEINSYGTYETHNICHTPLFEGELKQPIPNVGDIILVNEVEVKVEKIIIDIDNDLYLIYIRSSHKKHYVDIIPEELKEKCKIFKDNVDKFDGDKLITDIKMGLMEHNLKSTYDNYERLKAYGLGFELKHDIRFGYKETIIPIEETTLREVYYREISDCGARMPIFEIVTNLKTRGESVIDEYLFKRYSLFIEKVVGFSICVSDKNPYIYQEYIKPVKSEKCSFVDKIKKLIWRKSEK